MINMRGMRSDFRHDQNGMVSFLVVMIMMLVITLIVVGFSQVTRNNQREALDRELSAQAYYAAESGINLTEHVIKADLAASIPLAQKNNCTNNYDGSSITALDTGSGVKYTCVLVNPTPQTLTASSINVGDSVVFPIHTTSALSSLNFAWSASSSASNACIAAPEPASCSSQAESYFPSTASWQYPFALLRVDLLQVPAAVNGGALAQATDTLYLNPYGHHTGGVYGGDGNPATVSFGGANTAYYGAGCQENGTTGTCVTSADKHCINGSCVASVTLPTVSNYTYYVRVTPLYQDVPSVTISGVVVGPPPVAAQFQDAQAVIDVTGQDQDELQRVQARMDISGTASDIPSYALSSGGDVCKTFSMLSTDTLPVNLCP